MGIYNCNNQMQKITFVLASASAVLATSLDTMAEDKDVIMVSPNDASLYEVEPETQELDEAEFDDENMLQTEEEFFKYLKKKLSAVKKRIAKKLKSRVKKLVKRLLSGKLGKKSMKRVAKALKMIIKSKRLRKVIKKIKGSKKLLAKAKKVVKAILKKLGKKGKWILKKYGKKVRSYLKKKFSKK